MSRPTHFIQVCRRIETAIDRATSAGQGAHRTRAAMRREFASWLTRWYPAGDYTRISRLKLPWKQWDEELKMPCLRVAAAMRLLATERKKTRAWILKWTGMHQADLDYVLELLEAVGLTPHDVERDQAPYVGAAVAAEREALLVRLEARALEDMLLAAAEGYEVSPRRGVKYTEVFGLCFGSTRNLATNKDADELHINVGRIATQMRARATASEVSPNWRSLESQLAVADRFFPHFEVVGDYHTHPYGSFAALLQSKGWEHSDADEESIDYFVGKVRAHQSRPRFSIIVAVATGGRSGSGAYRRSRNVVQVSVKELFFVIAGYRIRLDGTYDQNLDLSLPAMIE
jgi:proteasome lid subunit RPN8/RPN11